MSDAILITLIGGGMVFVGLILLWVMMDLLVRFTQDKEEKVEVEETSGTGNGSSTKQKAAASAVATALAMQRILAANSAIVEKEVISPWASIGRSRQINSTVLFLRRKKD